MKKLIVFTDFEEVMEDLSWAERGRLFTAMLRYAADDTKQPDVISGNERFLWKAQKKSIDAQWASYRRICGSAEKARANNPNNRNQPESSSSETESSLDPVQDYDYDYNQENKRDSKEKKESSGTKFRPPTLEQVKAYCDERNNGIDPQSFLDFYQARNWKYGNTAIKDWKACVRTWENREKERAASKPVTTNPFLQYLMEGGGAE